MYSIALEQITLDEFEQLLTSIDLLPGRRILLDGLSGVVERLKRKKITHIAALQALLKKKPQYPEIARELAVSQDYLVILNREINSYVAKPVSLAKLDVFSEAVIKRLENAGIKSTADLYERCLTKAARRELATSARLSEQQITTALELADLLRINGVGPVFAKALREMGIKSTTDYLKTEATEILKKFQKVNAENEYAKARLGLKDIEYCKRFCRKLEAEIEW